MDEKIGVHAGKRLVAKNTVHCRTVAQKTNGLMFHAKITDTAYIFHFGKERHVSLHMMFVFFPIDVLFLDSGGKIVEMKEHFLPFTAYAPRKKAKTVIELPDGTIKTKQLRLGETISF